MDRATALAWSWMNVLNRKRYDALIERFGNLDAALSPADLALLRALGLREESAMRALNRLDDFDPDTVNAQLQESGIGLVTMDDEDYPAMLREIGDPPVFLYWRGDLSVLAEPCIALVGTREMSDYGRRAAETITQDIVRARVTTVSGLAGGIDTVVARETLASGGRTVAVLGHGFGSIYPPRNSTLAEEIVQEGGLLLSEYPLDIAPDRYTFPARNRIIAGLSLGTVVLEAPEGSGALITAELALDYGREVFAVPGQIFDDNYAGANGIIGSGQARLVADASEILREVGIEMPDGEEGGTFTPDSPEEETVYNTLTTMPQPVDDLVEKAALDAAVVNATLTVLELRGAAKNVGSGNWVKTA